MQIFSAINIVTWAMQCLCSFGYTSPPEKNSFTTHLHGALEIKVLEPVMSIFILGDCPFMLINDSLSAHSLLNCLVVCIEFIYSFMTSAQ